MSWLDALTRNWAELADDHPDPRLRPLFLSGSRDESVRRVASILAGLPRWRVVAADAEAGTLHAIHFTRLWRFVDDVHLRFESRPAGGTRVTARSQSRIGKGDLGQNARNLRALTAAVNPRQER